MRGHRHQGGWATRAISVAVAGAAFIAASSVLPLSAHAAPGARPAAGTAANPLVIGCAAAAWTPTPVPQSPQPGDLAAGPLIIPEGEKLANANPKSFGDHGSYKVPFIVKMGATVTVTIERPARGLVLIDNPYSPVGGVTAITYRACGHQAGLYPQDIVFGHGLNRGCVPLGVQAGARGKARQLMLSLFAGRC